MITPRSENVPTRLPSAKLYLDDIEQIQRVLERAVEKNHSHWNREPDTSFRIFYEVAGQTCTELTDLPKFGLKLRGCKIQFVSDTVTGSIGLFREGSLWTTAGLTKPIAWEAFHDIEAIFKPRRVTPYQLFVPPLLVPVIAAILLLIASQEKWSIRELPISFAIAVAVGGFLAILGSGVNSRSGSLIVTVNSWEKQRENREFRTKILQGAVISVISGLCGALVGYLFGRHH
jgi:hypothetical protein